MKIMPQLYNAPTLLRTKLLWLTICILFLSFPQLLAQTLHDGGTGLEEAERESGFDNDSIERTDVPEGIYVWTVSKRFGDIRPADYDTIPHGFQNSNSTMGETGHYNFTGNMGSPRISRYFYEQGENMQYAPFFFIQPYDFFLKDSDKLLYTNTKSPFTNLTYHSCGNKTNGEDRIKALFSVNAGKKVGVGFVADYLYGRGYYEAQSTAHFNGTLYGSYIDEKYRLHAYLEHIYLKTRENGGIENDDYVNRPESFPTKYGTSDMPVNLSRAFNKIGGNKFYLTQRYSMGFRRYRDARGNIVKTPVTPSQPTLSLQTDTLKRLNADSIAVRLPRMPKSAKDDYTLHTNTPNDDTLRITSEFVPVSSIIHTMTVKDYTRRYISNESNNADNPGFYKDFYWADDYTSDKAHQFGVENTIALEMHEGFNKWMKMGLRLYGKHEYAKYTFTIPPIAGNGFRTTYNENYITLGGQLIESHNRIIRYKALGEIRTTGTDWGEFNVEAEAALEIPLRRDSLRFSVNGFVRNERPSFYYRHYVARNAYWDNDDLNKMLHARVSATLRYKQTALTATLENIQNYTYLQESIEAYEGEETYALYRHGVSVQQSSKNVQLLALTLNQDLKFGIFNWNNEFTYQATTNSSVYPVPAFSAYSNVFLIFHIAKVLRTELGADVRFFTRYYAPTYSPLIGQYAIQDKANAVKIGNYPMVSAYVNFHLKRTRFYLKASHLNYSSGSGNPFLVPHYPLNRMTIHFGISWNFIN